jgi:hypothetical protein
MSSNAPPAWSPNMVTSTQLASFNPSPYQIDGGST